MKRVGINAQLLSGQAGYRSAGIHVYILNILRHLPDSAEFSPVVFTQPGAASLLSDLKHLQVQMSQIPTHNPMVRIAWEQTAWSLLAARHRIDLLHSMAFVTPLLSPLSKLVTVFDLSFMHFPERYTPFKRWYLQTQTRRSVQSADRVIAIAEDGKRDLQQVFGVAENRIDVVTPGVDPMYRPLPSAEVTAFKEKMGLTRPFLLHVGTLQPRKNIPVLIDAFAKLNDPNLDLVLVGGKGWLYDEIFARVERLNLSDRVHFTGYVPDEQLPFWYNAASAFIFPSVYEGFGIPAADAMACGTPVIASNASSLPEVVGEAGLLFAPQAVPALTACIDTVINDKARAAEMSARGIRQAEKFSWQRSGAQMAAIYQRVLNTA